MAISEDGQKRGAWEARFARFHASGHSVVRFCQEERVSTNTFYYWAKRLKAASARPVASSDPRRQPQPPSVPARADGSVRQAVVRLRWSTGGEALVPAGCIEALRCLAECLACPGGRCAQAFQEVVVKA
jgi:hypothetical protein